MQPDDIVWAGAVALGFLGFMAYAITVLRHHPKLAAIIAALATLAAVLPGVLYALNAIR